MLPFRQASHSWPASWRWRARKHWIVVLGTLAASIGFGQLPSSKLPPPRAEDNSGQPISIARSQAPIRFRDIAAQAGLMTIPRSSSERRYLVETMGGGGIALFDCDNDGKLDIAVVNDSTIEQYLRGGDPMITLYHQDSDSGKIHFTDVTQSAGLTTRGWGNAIAVGDYDNDGLPDGYLDDHGPIARSAGVGRRQVAEVLFRLIGTKSNRAAVGARVTVYTSSMTQIDEVRGGGSYNSTNDTRLHFGLGRDAMMSAVKIQWPSGLQEEFRNVAGDAIYEIIEGQTMRKTLPLRPPGK